MSDSEQTTSAQVVHHHYIPIRNWMFTKGNFVMVQFMTSVPDELIAKGFTSPTAGSTIDTDLVNHLKTMGKGQAILLPKDDSITERSLKVRVNKAAKEAGRKLEWAKIDEGHLARVVLVLNASANGQVTAEAPAIESETSTATEESAPTRNRR